MLNSFPVPSGTLLVGPVAYAQSIQSNAVWMESVSYTSRETPPLVLLRITNWLARYHIPSPTRVLRGHETLAGSKRNVYEWGQLSPSVMLHQEEDGTSWVMMSNAR